MRIFFALITACVVLLSGGCANSNANSNAYENGEPAQPATDYIIEIPDLDFMFRVIEIQMNRDYYLGRMFRFRGMMVSFDWEDEVLYFVARFDGGCCGLHGFEVYLNDIASVPDDTWVEVTGVLEEFYVEDVSDYFLRLSLTSLVEI